MTEQNKIKEVRVIHSVYDGVDVLNKLLAEGWVLLSTAGGIDGEGYPIHTWTVGCPF